MKCRLYVLCLILGGADKHYHFPKTKKATLSGVLTPEHAKHFTESCMKAARSNKLFNPSRDMYGMVRELTPWNGARSHRREKFDACVDLVLSEDSATKDVGIKVNLTHSTADLLKSLASGQVGYELNVEQAKSLEVMSEHLLSNLERIHGYVQSYEDGMEPSAKRAVLLNIGQFKSFVCDLEKPDSFLGFVASLSSAEKDIAQEINNCANLSNLNWSDRAYDYKTGEALNWISIGGDEAAIIQSYLEHKLALLKKADVTSDDIADFEQQADSQKAISILESIRSAESHIYDFFKQDNIDGAIAFALEIEQEVRHSALCALKNSGKYGEPSLLQAFTHAIEAQSKLIAKEQDNAPEENEAELVVPSLFGSNETALTQLNKIIEADMRMQGWDGNWPEKAREKLPDSYALHKTLCDKFNVHDGRYGMHMKMDEASLVLSEDATYRIEYAETLKEYLNKAQSFVSDERKQQIASTVQSLDKNVLQGSYKVAEQYKQPSITIGLDECTLLP